MEVGEGPNWGCSAKEKKLYLIYFYISGVYDFALHSSDETRMHYDEIVASL
jgi:hypothetical protein